MAATLKLEIVTPEAESLFRRRRNGDAARGVKAKWAFIPSTCR